MKKLKISFLLCIAATIGCKSLHNEKLALKTFPIRMQSLVKGLKTSGPPVTLKRTAVPEKTAVWSVDLRMVSKQQGKLMPSVRMSMEEHYKLVSVEKPESKGGLTADIRVESVRIKSIPPVPRIEKEAQKRMENFRCSARIDSRGRFVSVDPKNNTTKRAVTQITNLLNMLDILPDKPLHPGESYANDYTRQTRLIGGGILNRRFHMEYTFKGTMDYKGKRVAVFHATYSAKGDTAHTDKAGSTMQSMGKGSALILVNMADGSLVGAEMHLGSLTRGTMAAKKKSYEFTQYNETHFIIHRVFNKK